LVSKKLSSFSRSCRFGQLNCTVSPPPGDGSRVSFVVIAAAKQRANRIGLALQENLLLGVGAEEGT